MARARKLADDDRAARIRAEELSAGKVHPENQSEVFRAARRDISRKTLRSWVARDEADMASFIRLRPPST